MTDVTDEVDVLVVGAGSAGCVVAARLSEDPGRTVAVLEAGGPDADPDVAVPLRALQLLRGPLDWSDSSVPQPALDGRTLPTSAGRVLGGGGSINFLAWVRDGARESTSRAYLRPAQRRPNLTVRTGAHVRRVLVERGRAVGVEWRDASGQVHRTRAGTVVLSAGVFRSPQLLMLSGIGPADQLAGHGIDVVVDLTGVGANLHDHPAVVAVWPAARGTSWAHADGPAAQAAYAEHRGGPLASIGQAVAFLRTDPALAAPDVQLTLLLLHDDPAHADQPGRRDARLRRPGRPAGHRPGLVDDRSRPLDPAPGRGADAGPAARHGRARPPSTPR